MSVALEDAKVLLSTNPDLLWYTSVMYQLDILEGESKYGTAHVQGTTITIDPRLLERISDKELQGVILHEVRHVSDMHSLRREGRNPSIWNDAADHVINLDILSMGMSLPDFGLADVRFKGMSAEEVYDVLEEEGGESENQMPDLGDAPSEGELKEIEQDIQDILIQATQLAQRTGGKAAGNIPSNVLRQVEEWLNPVLPWQTVLQRYLTQKCKDAYSWKRPSRRLIPHRIYTPSLYSKQVGDINIYLDASCSVSDEMFAMQVGQFKYIHRNIKPKTLRIVVFNTRIVDEYVFTPNQNIDIEFKGQGGTSIREVVPHMLNNPAECNLIFTDAFVDLSPMADATKEEVIWCVYDNPNFTTDVGKVIHI